MDEFDQLINFQDKAYCEGRKEADKHFIKQKLPEKAEQKGFDVGNEIAYYQTIIELNKDKIDKSPHKKLINKHITTIEKIIEQVERENSIVSLDKLKIKFKVR